MIGIITKICAATVVIDLLLAIGFLFGENYGRGEGYKAGKAEADREWTLTKGL